jgi:uroporphyrinogen-III synthase
MISTRLSGITVLVTRPRELADSLCRGITAAGGEAIPWPAIEIEPQAAASPALARLRDAGPEALVVFVSRNAVTHGAQLVSDRSRPIIASIGPSTAAALTALGLHPDILPDGHDSEALLASPQLRDVSDRQVFIVRGVGGRELLGASLAERGATVTYLEVYDRQPARHAPERVAALLRHWRAGGVDVYTATSVAIYDCLQAGLGPEGARLMAGTALVTASRRVVKRAQEQGHDAPQLLAPGPDDASLLEAIAGWAVALPTRKSATDQNND